MKLLVISAAFPPMRAGEADHALELCIRLADHGLSVHVLTTRGAMQDEGAPFRVYPLMHNWSWLELPRLAAFLRSCAPDTVALMYTGWIYNNEPMITFAPTLTKRLLPKVTFVTQLETDEESSSKSFVTRAVRKGVQYLVGPRNVDYLFGTLFRDSDRLIALSELHLARFSARFAGVERKSIVIPPPPLMHMCPHNRDVGRKLGRERLGVKDDEFLLAFFGYADRNKGVDTLIKAVHILSKRRNNVRLVMIGGGRGTSTSPVTERAQRFATYEQQLQSLPNDLGIADRIIWLRGYAPESDDASTNLLAADVCVLPFDRGVTLNRSSVAAAAAHGLPIITTNGGHVESPFKHADNVFLCPPKDPEALAVAINALIESPQLRRQLGDGALQLAREWFSWEKAIDQTIDALGGHA